MAYLLQNTLTYTIPLLIVALAGIFAERSGIINLALEGIMILGAFIGVLVVYSFQKAGLFVKDQGQMLMWVALGISAVAGAVFSLLLAFASINLKADQTIGGTALNMLAPALVLFLINIIINQNTLGMFTGDASSWFMLKKSDFGLGDVPVGELNLFQSVFMHKIYPTTFICIILFIILSVILYKTKFGLRLRACGENPQAADSLGINVYKMRYAGVVISGALAGIGGFVYALTTANCASTGDVAGFGFLALAVMIFGNWKPLSTAGAAFLFGLCKCIAAGYSSIDINGDKIYALKDLGDRLKTAGIDPGSLFRILPFLITLIVLAFTSKNSRAPKAEGIPYDKGSR
jgi:simple sugar transport system permease protein